MQVRMPCCFDTLSPPCAVQFHHSRRHASAGAENAAELSECADPSSGMAPGYFPGATSKPGDGASPSSETKREMLMGSATSLDECLVDAENALEVAECQSDYEELVSGDPDDSTMLNVGPIALVAVGVILAAANLLGN